MKTRVKLSKRATKDLRVVPWHIVIKFKSWVDLVEAQGLLQARRIPGYHDEPLKGDRLGQRSIRLSRSYRAIYKTEESGQAEIIKVEEVTKHDY